MRSLRYVSVNEYVKVPDDGGWMQQDRYQNEAMTAATYGVDDLWLTREPRSLLCSIGNDSNASTQQHDQYMLRNGPVATAIHVGAQNS